MHKPAKMIAILTSLVSTLASANPKVIYGEDGRQEVYEASEMNQKLAKSTATMVSLTKMTRSAERPGIVSLNQKTLKEWMESLSSPVKEKMFSAEVIQAADAGLSFCESERFITQPNPGMCSGFLIAPDLLVTAGHCVTSLNFCTEYKWVFDFSLDKETQTAGVDVKEANIYGCKKVVSTTLNGYLALDYAIIQLDRIVEDRLPLDIRSENRIEDNAQLTVIGSPSGLPLKVTAGGAIRKNVHPNFFTGNLDTYQGNSGSAVFNAKTGVVEGILVRGETDFVPNAVGTCIESNRCVEGECRGEDVSRLTSVPEIATKVILTQAAEAGDKALLGKILKNKLWVDFYGKDRKSALMKAAAKGQSISIEMLVANGADVSLTDLEGNTALHFLAPTLSDESAEALDKLIAAKASLEARNKASETALMVAAKNHNMASVKLLIKAGAEKNVLDKSGETILFAFARQGDLAAVLELSELGVDSSIPNRLGVSVVNLRDAAGDTLLLKAAKLSTIENVLRLVKMGSDINAKDALGETAIYSVIRSQSIEGLKMIIAAGARVQIENNQGTDPMKLVKELKFKVAKKIIRTARRDEKRKKGLSARR